MKSVKVFMAVFCVAVAATITMAFMDVKVIKKSKNHDNGKGFVAPSSDANGSHEAGQRDGLGNMRHRMETIGGRFHVRSEAGHGARLLLEIELKN